MKQKIFNNIGIYLLVTAITIFVAAIKYRGGGDKLS